MRYIFTFVRRANMEDRNPCYREVVLPQPRVKVAQTFRLGWSAVFNNRITAVRENIFGIAAGWKRGIQNPYSAGEPPICGKDSGDQFRDLISSRILAADVVDLHHRAAETFPTGRSANDWTWTQEKGCASRAPDSLAIPAARRQDADSICGFVIGKAPAILLVDENSFAGTLWSFQRFNLAN
jgi:hypothetical protein